MFIPTTKEEMDNLGWDRLDVILVSGDSYIDSPYIGAAVIGKVLMDAGYRVGIIAQPDIESENDITRLGEPTLFWGVTAGSIDSMVANYTATKKKRHSDDYTPGGENVRRPDRATIIYSNLIRRYYKETVPLVLGGVEASLRRIAHYDFWSDKVRRSVLLDAKADILVYGMGEKTILELAEKLKNGQGYENQRGICYLAAEKRFGYFDLPSFEEVSQDKEQFIKMFHAFYRNNDPLNAVGLCQEYDNRYLIQNPPNHYLTQAELDKVYALDYERCQHPYYEKMGPVRAVETIRFSVNSHRGCYGECNFCAIAVHEGRTIRWRSTNSIVAEVENLTKLPDFKGYILDVGGPTANMYGFECNKKLKSGSCKDKRCIYPEICSQMPIDHQPQINLLRRLRLIEGVKQVRVASGLRYDMVLADRKTGFSYLQEIVRHHVAGQMKLAPEHSQESVLKRMGKPGVRPLIEFRRIFLDLSKKIGKQQFLTYYMIAAHPGCTMNDMYQLKDFANRELKMNPEQVQVFTPTPSTYSTLMYYTGVDPFSGEEIFVEKDYAGIIRQKEIAVQKGQSQREYSKREDAGRRPYSGRSSQRNQGRDGDSSQRSRYQRDDSQSGEGRSGDSSRRSRYQRDGSKTEQGQGRDGDSSQRSRYQRDGSRSGEGRSGDSTRRSRYQRDGSKTEQGQGRDGDSSQRSRYQRDGSRSGEGRSGDSTRRSRYQRDGSKTEQGQGRDGDSSQRSRYQRDGSKSGEGRSGDSTRRSRYQRDGSKTEQGQSRRDSSQRKRYQQEGSQDEQGQKDHSQRGQGRKGSTQRSPYQQDGSRGGQGRKDSTQRGQGKRDSSRPGRDQKGYSQRDNKRRDSSQRSQAENNSSRKSQRPNEDESGKKSED